MTSDPDFKVTTFLKSNIGKTARLKDSYFVQEETNHARGYNEAWQKRETALIALIIAHLLGLYKNTCIIHRL